MGGPYGAAAGAARYVAQHGKKFLAAIAVLLMLPVLFILMLPSLIFGGLTSSGSSGQPILNDNAAIVQNTNDIAFQPHNLPLLKNLFPPTAFQHKFYCTDPVGVRCVFAILI